MRYIMITRPSLAAELLTANQRADLTQNPFDPGRTAWKFDATPEAGEIIRAYYARIGKPLPASIAREIEVLHDDE